MNNINFGQLCDDLYALNEETARINVMLKEVDDRKREKESFLLEAMQAAGTKIVRGSRATVSVTTSIRPQIEDFAAFEQFVYRKKALHLMEKRIAGNAFKEQVELLGGKMVPGLKVFEQDKLSVRKV